MSDPLRSLMGFRERSGLHAPRVIDDLAGPRTLTPAPRDFLARLKARRLIRGDTYAGLTAKGEALHRSLREYLADPTARPLSQSGIAQHRDGRPHAAGHHQAGHPAVIRLCRIDRRDQPAAERTSG
jgi:hypothetical protein